MAVSPRLIRRRIRSVQNTKKITKAMEMVAAAKMRRAVAAALRSRAYARLAWDMVASLEGVVAEEAHPLLRTARDGTETATLTIVMGSDRGLCGGFNAALFRTLKRDVESEHASAVRCIAVGKKAEQFVRRQGWELVASFTNMSVAPKVAELRPVARIAMDVFISGEVHRVRIAFTDFISSLRQEPLVKTLLPLQRIEEVGAVYGPTPSHSPSQGEGEKKSSFSTSSQNGEKESSFPTSRREGGRGGVVMSGFLFEPDPKAVLDRMLPRLVELQVYQAYLDTGASEHSARMLAMRNASDAARDMIDGLTLSLNRARQAMITQEIAEISAGRAALVV